MIHSHRESQSIYNLHPIRVIDYLRKSYGSELTLSFSEYRYSPQSVFDERYLFEVPIDQVSVEWFSEKLATLQDGWDLALNSVVVDKRDRRQHIPMIDFAKRCVEEADIALMRSIIGNALTSSFLYFDSGRSFHAYGLQLISPGEWREFMAKLLLLNMPAGEHLIDARWVGHRLVAGYGALRWSANSDFYLQVPRATQIKAVHSDRGALG